MFWLLYSVLYHCDENLLGDSDLPLFCKYACVWLPCSFPVVCVTWPLTYTVSHTYLDKQSFQTGKIPIYITKKIRSIYCKNT